MKRIYLMLLLAFNSILVFAQNGGGGADLNVNVTESGGSSFPWLWVVGAIVLIVLLIALLGGRRGDSSHTTRTTIIKDKS